MRAAKQQQIEIKIFLYKRQLPAAFGYLNCSLLLPLLFKLLSVVSGPTLSALYAHGERACVRLLAKAAYAQFTKMA